MSWEPLKKKLRVALEDIARLMDEVEAAKRDEAEMVRAEGRAADLQRPLEASETERSVRRATRKNG